MEKIVPKRPPYCVIFASWNVAVKRNANNRFKYDPSKDEISLNLDKCCHQLKKMEEFSDELRAEIEMLKQKIDAI